MADSFAQNDSIGFRHGTIIAYPIVVSYNVLMVIIGLISWWYGAGWLSQVRVVRGWLDSIYDYFSIELLARTLFSPFRQDSAGKVKGPVNVIFRHFLDNLTSRFIGAFIRSFMIILGVISIAIVGLIGLITMIIWPLIPVMPLIGLVMTFIGWTPR